MRGIIFLIFISMFSSCALNSQIEYNVNYQKNDAIIWGDSSLKWSDFQGQVIPTNLTKEDAVTWTSIKLFEPAYDENQIVYFIVCYFEKKDSYVITEKATNELLKHEQVHFDISELFTRKIRKELSSEIYRETDILLVFERVEKIFLKYVAEKNEYQSQYDVETNHGSDMIAQLMWEKKIENELNEYKKWSNLKVVLKRELPKEYLELGK